MLVLSDIVPPDPMRYLDAAFLGYARSEFAGALILGEDGDYCSLSAGSTEIERGNWF